MKKITIQWNKNSLELSQKEFRVDVHHWQTLHARLTCMVTEAKCTSCIIEDLCKDKQKTTDEGIDMRILHTMLRVGDLERSISFYQDVLGMRLLRRSDNEQYQYTLAFMGYDDMANSTVLELTYNWGVTSYDLGAAFGHIAIEVDDVYGACEKIKSLGGVISREPGPVKGGTTEIAFVKDPDGYAIELIQAKEN